MNDSLLWYRAPAVSFLEALPLGNGRLGAMVYGQVDDETVELNEDTLWAGGPGDRNDYTAADHLDALREAVLRDRDHVRAERLAEAMQGPDTQPYQPLGTLRLDHRLADPPGAYRRSLDLSSATSTVRLSSDGAEHTRTTFVSAPAGVLVHRIDCSASGRVGFTARVDTPHPADRDGELTLGRAPAHVDGAAGPVYAADTGTGFVIGLRVLAEGGSVHTLPDGRVTVSDADAATVLVAAATGYLGWRTEPTGPDAALRDQVTATLDAAAARTHTELRTEHRADHARLYGRAGLHLGAADPSRSRLPTDERLAAVRSGAADPGLSALHFDYGRYLLIASSRPGTQPANLQGIWNRDRQPAWNCDWTTNINTQMNYWPAESTGLAECHEPLFDLVADLAESGKRTARAYYRCGGWAAHHNVDLWRGGNPVSGSPQWANWPMAGPWLCAHLWQHYRYSGDLDFLAERGYPAMRGAALFLLDFLVEHDNPDTYPDTSDGSAGHTGRTLVTCPSTSPEHRFHAPDGTLVSVSANTAMDYWLTDELFESCARAAALLGVDADLAARLEAARARLRRPRVGPGGDLLEWWEELPDEDPGHRHLSHLYGLYPGHRITAEDTPELHAAARLALHRRLDNGGGGTGWSLAWVTALAARLGEGELAHRGLVRLLADSTAPNLFDLHPPSIFQIDGNLGATAAIVELLLQNRAEELRLLPALPRAWAGGTAHGLRAHGGTTVDLEWHDQSLRRATLHTTRPGTVTVTAPTGGRALRVTGPDGAPVPAAQDLADGTARTRFPTRPGGRYLLRADRSTG